MHCEKLKGLYLFVYAQLEKNYYICTSERLTLYNEIIPEGRLGQKIFKKKGILNAILKQYVESISRSSRFFE